MGGSTACARLWYYGGGDLSIAFSRESLGVGCAEGTDVRVFFEGED